jgi:hypothetical protein
MACLLFLTGCFGLMDDTITPEAEGQTSTSVDNSTNNAPFIDTISLLNDVMYAGESAQRDISNDPTTGDEILNGFNLSLHHAAIDIDGDAMTMGWDINLDGSVDVPTTVASGITNLSIGIEHWTDVSSLIDEEGYYHAIVAFIAIDEHGAGNAEFVEVWGWDNDDDNSGGGGGLTLYVFDAEDASGSPTDGTSDNLVRVTMTQGSAINWAAISITISVNNEAPVTCNNPGMTGQTCDLVAFGDTTDNEWTVGDGVTIVENGASHCDASPAPCNITVTITDTQQGAVIDQSSATSS